MPNWKKVVVSGSSAHLNQITGSGNALIVGNVGIGSLSKPADILHLSDGTSETRVQIENTGTGDPILMLQTVDLSLEGDLTLSGSFESQFGNISGSSSSTGSFGRVEATKLSGDGSSVTNVIGTDPNAVVFGIVFGG